MKQCLFPLGCPACTDDSKRVLIAFGPHDKNDPAVDRTNRDHPFFEI